MDHGCASPLRPEARSAIVRAAATAGNPSSLHAVGRLAKRELDLAMEAVRALVATPKADVVFTGSGAEANDLGIIGMARFRNGGVVLSPRVSTRRIDPGVTPPAGSDEYPTLARRRVLVGPDESQSVLRAVATLEAAGFIREPLYDAELRDDVALIVLGVEEASTGRRNDTYAIAREAERLGIPLHVDARRAAAVCPIDLVGSGATTMAIASETLGGPHGAGALVKLKGTELTPLWLGGGQEGGLRHGSQAVLLIAGFGAAAAATAAERPKVRELDAIWSGLGLAAIGSSVVGSSVVGSSVVGSSVVGSSVVGSSVVGSSIPLDRLPNISALALDDASADRLLLTASERGLMLRRVLVGVQACAGWSTTQEDVEAARLALASCVRDLQKAP
jgi:cysteine desulfurase